MPTTPISIDSFASWMFEQSFSHLDRLGFFFSNPSFDSTILPKDCSSKCIGISYTLSKSFREITFSGGTSQYKEIFSLTELSTSFSDLQIMESG